MLVHRVLIEAKIDSLWRPGSKTVTLSADRLRDRARLKKILQHYRHPGEFYIESDLSTGYITWTHGFHDWMQHPDPKAGVDTIDALSQYIHPLIAPWYRVFLWAITKIMTELPTQYLSSGFCITVPMRAGDGEYLLVKHMGLEFGKTIHGEPGALLNIFDIYGAYRSEPMSIELWEGMQKPGNQETERLHRYVHPYMDIQSRVNLTLTLGDFFIMDRIAELIALNIPRTCDQLEKIYEKVKGRPIGLDALKQRLNRLHRRLKWLLWLDKKMPADYRAGENERFMPDYQDVYALVDFLQRSGIIAQLRYYYRERGFKPPPKKNK
jgi:hypothetical protein